MSKLHRLTPKRIERLKGAVIKDVTTEEIPAERTREGCTATIAIDLEDGRYLLFMAREYDGENVCEMMIGRNDNNSGYVRRRR